MRAPPRQVLPVAPGSHLPRCSSTGRSVDVDALDDRAVTEPGFLVWVTNAAASPIRREVGASEPLPTDPTREDDRWRP